jgi:hypothetical protein
MMASEFTSKTMDLTHLTTKHEIESSTMDISTTEHWMIIWICVGAVRVYTMSYNQLFIIHHYILQLEFNIYICQFLRGCNTKKFGCFSVEKNPPGEQHQLTILQLLSQASDHAHHLVTPRSGNWELASGSHQETQSKTQEMPGF